MSDFAHLEQHYLPHVQDTRYATRDDPSVRAVLRDGLDATAQLGFLIEFAAIGVRLLRPGEETLCHAAKVCLAAGFTSLGVELERLGQETAQRRLLLLDDLVQLAELWREQVASAGAALDLAALVRRPAPAAAQRHAALREHAALDELPFDSIAIELELGEFAREFGPRLMRACEAKIGSQVFAGLRYMQARTEHAALGSDSLLEELDGLVRIAPQLGAPMAAAGSAALRAHLDVLAVCVARGRRLGTLERPRVAQAHDRLQAN